MPTMRFISSSLLAATLSAALMAAPVAAQTFGSDTPTNAAQIGSDVGAVGAAAQTFTTPTGSPLLQSFTFYLNDAFGGVDLRVQAHVFAWSIDHVVGPALYGSDVRTGSSNVEGYDAYTFSDVNLVLTPGTMYALVLRTAASSSDGATNFFGTTDANTFTLGQLFLSNRSSVAQLTANGAFTSGGDFGADAAVRATFAPAVTATPEPATLLLVSSGLGGIVGFARRRRRKGET